MNDPPCSRLAIMTVLAVVLIRSAVWAQVLGEEAEMERLQNKADEAIENGDHDGAALNMGKAALMASQLAKKQSDKTKAHWLYGAENLFRAQEQAYRAQALFERAGGQVPASSGVCGSLQLAKQHLDKSMNLLLDAAYTTLRSQRLQAAAFEWVKTIEGLNTDFQCRWFEGGINNEAIQNRR